MSTTNEQPGDALISSATVAGMFEVHEKTVRMWALAGRIPRPVVNRRGYTRWSRNEVLAHIESIKRGELAEAAS